MPGSELIGNYNEIYTASKVKHSQNIFLEQIVKFSKQVFILMRFLKVDITVTIYSKV